MKRHRSIGALILVITGLLTLVLTVSYASDALRALASHQRAIRVPVLVDISNDLFDAVQLLRLERGTSNAYLAMPDAADAVSRDEISTMRLQSRKAIESALAKLQTVSVAGIEPAVGDIKRDLNALEVLRGQIDDALRKPKALRPAMLGADWIAGNGDVIACIDSISTRLDSELSQIDPFIADMTGVKKVIWLLRSESGDERLRIREVMARGTKLSDEQHLQFAVQAGRIEALWNLIKDEALRDTTPQNLKDAIATTDRLYFREYRALRTEVISDLAAGRPPRYSDRKWEELSMPGRQSNLALAKIAFKAASDHAAEQTAKTKRSFLSATLFMFLFSGIGGFLAWYVFRMVVQPIHQITETMGRVAEGNLSCPIPFETRRDEIGLLARALRVFRDNAVEKEEIYRAKVEAETANRVKSEFLANMSHELRTPLNAIIGFSEIIKTGMFGPLEERYRSYGTDIFHSGTHLLRLINEILDLSKLDAGQLKLHEETVDLAALVAATKHMVEAPAEKSNIEISVDVDSGVKFVRADEQRLR